MQVMKRCASALLALSLALPAAGAVSAAGETGTEWLLDGTGELNVKLLARYSSGAPIDEAGAEIVKYDPASKKAFVVNGAEKSIDIVDLSGLRSGEDVESLKLTARIKLEDLLKEVASIGDITSVAVSPKGDFIAITLPSDPKTDNGKVALLDLNGRLLAAVEVGALPDMLTFTPDGKAILVANEGEPNDEYTIDPEGSVSIIDVSAGADKVTQDSVTTVLFDAPIEGHVHKGNGGSAQKDMEPEYITVNPDGKKAYVALQEANAIAVLNLESKKIEKITALGVKQHTVPGSGLDASDKDDKINIQPWPVLGMYQPDGIDLVSEGGKTYLITANEGDTRDYDGFSEEQRVEDVKDQLALQAKNYPGVTQKQLDAVAATLTEKSKLGRLKITNIEGHVNGKYEALYSFGARSFSVWDADTMKLVYDSGDAFEQTLARVNSEMFNTSNDENEADSRSDDKGPEPEDVEIGQVGENRYAFIGLERPGGIFAYNLNDPKKPEYAAYFSSRDYSGKEVAGDSAPEGLEFIPAAESPTGQALLLAAHEVSGTVAVYELTEGQKKDVTRITILHTNDSHGRAEESSNDGMGFAKLGTLARYYEENNPNTLLLDAGDTMHGTNFATLVKGESIAKVMNELGYDAMAAGNHDFNYGYQRLLELDQITKFPILSANVRKEDGERLLTPYVIEEVDGLKLGIFGLTTPETTYKTHPNNVKGLTFVDPAVEAKPIVEELKSKGVDAIIAVTHLGIDESSTDTSIKLAKEVPGIDLIVDGHSHTTLVEGLEGGNDTLIVSAGEYTKNLGVVELTFEGKKLSGIDAKLVSKEAAALTTPDEQITNIIDGVKKEQEQVLSQVIGKTSVKLDGEREQVRAMETNLGNLITDAMLDVTGADAALTNGGGIRASIDAGSITKGNVITVLPFGNYIVTKQVTGADIKAALENGVDSYPKTKGAFPQVAGMSFVIDETKPAGERVHSLKIGGVDVDMNKQYVLATNDFLAAGGDQYTMLGGSKLLGEFPALDEALIAYIQKKGDVAPAVEGRITVKSAAAPAQQPAAPAAPAAPAVTPAAPAAPAAPSADVYTIKPGDTLWAIAKSNGTTWQQLAELNKLENPHLIFPGQAIRLK
ncbi:choice-of-anchor I family protein [Paenibacillus turpanensis]|uniref:choice-of-anchor I family protein n=1 Tax=Paenibacillus turpanensis TaxID=2689078 RepID=UPI001A9E4B17|nr:choice-of-anchor I family protein [Paenibacillus turpanensis]